MKRSIILILILAFIVSLSLPAVFAAKLGGKELVKLGTGKRTMFIVGTVYFATLQVAEELKGKSAKEIVDADLPMSVIMSIDTKMLTREKFIKAVREGFDKAAAAGYPTDKKDQFLNLFSSLEFTKGDAIFLNYAPGAGLTASYKPAGGAVKAVGTVPGLAFKKALFAIWLGPNPVQESLKNGMLGK